MASPPGFYSSDNLGFRCVRPAGEHSGSDGGMKISRQFSNPKLTPVDDAEFARLAAAYDYPKQRLNPRVVKRIDAEAWTLEVIEFEGAEGERVPAYLYLPRNRARPYQVVQFQRFDGSTGSRRTDDRECERSCVAVWTIWSHGRTSIAIASVSTAQARAVRLA